MEITKDQAREALKQWQENSTTVALLFSARSGTAGVTMTATITHVSARIVFKNEFTILRFVLDRARYEYGPLMFFRFPAREGLAQVNGLHIYLESGHRLFIANSQQNGVHWLRSLNDMLVMERKNELGSGDREEETEAELACLEI